jgi:lysophospholipase L1-like esterase
MGSRWLVELTERRRHFISRGALAWLGVALCAGCLRKAPAPAEPRLAVAVPESDAAPAAEPIEIPSGPERPDQASPRRVEQPWMSLAEWRRRYERQLALPGRKQAQMVVLGDSIVEAWCDSAAFRSQFGARAPLNLGLGGDQTQHLLWRIDHGILDGLAPRVAILLIGVNNLGNGFSPEETALGVRAVLDRLRQKLPGTPVLLLAVLPAGETSGDGLRTKIVATNPELLALAVPGQVRVADLGGVLLEGDGSISRATMGDFLHPTAAGYQRLTSAVRPLVDELSAGSK